MEEKASQLDSTLKEKMDAIKVLNNEIDKYKAHIMFLTETNQKLFFLKLIYLFFSMNNY